MTILKPAPQLVRSMSSAPAVLVAFAVAAGSAASAGCGPSENTKIVVAAWEVERSRWIMSETGPLPIDPSERSGRERELARDKLSADGVRAGDAEGKKLVDRIMEEHRSYAASFETPPPGLVEVRTETEAKVAAAVKSDDAVAVARAIDEGGKRREAMRTAQLKVHRDAIDQTRAAIEAHVAKVELARKQAFDAEQERVRLAHEEALRSTARTKDGVGKFQVRFTGDHDVATTDPDGLQRVLSFMNTCAPLKAALTVEGPTPAQGKARATALKRWLASQKASGAVSSVDGAAHASMSIFESSGGGLATLRVVKPCP